MWSSKWLLDTLWKSDVSTTSFRVLSEEFNYNLLWKCSYFSLEASLETTCTWGMLGNINHLFSSEKNKSLICNICQFPWCKYSHCGLPGNAEKREIFPNWSSRLSVFSWCLFPLSSSLPSKDSEREEAGLLRRWGREADGFKLLPFKHLCRALETRVVRKPKALLL